MAQHNVETTDLNQDNLQQSYKKFLQEICKKKRNSDTAVSLKVLHVLN